MTDHELLLALEPHLRRVLSPSYLRSTRRVQEWRVKDQQTRFFALITVATAALAKAQGMDEGDVWDRLIGFICRKDVWPADEMDVCELCEQVWAASEAIIQPTDGGHR